MTSNQPGAIGLHLIERAHACWYQAHPIYGKTYYMSWALGYIEVLSYSVLYQGKCPDFKELDVGPVSCSSSNWRLQRGGIGRKKFNTQNCPYVGTELSMATCGHVVYQLSQENFARWRLIYVESGSCWIHGKCILWAAGRTMILVQCSDTPRIGSYSPRTELLDRSLCLLKYTYRSLCMRGRRKYRTRRYSWSIRGGLREN